MKLLAASLVLALWTHAHGIEDNAPSHERMVEELARIAQETDQANPFLGSRLLVSQAENYEQLAPNAPVPARFEALVWLGIAELNHGLEREAIEHLEEAISLVRNDEHGMEPHLIVNAAEMLVTACIRLAETENCCALPSAESCIFPLQGKAIHQRREGSETAVRHLSWILKRPNLDEEQHRHALWLLNLAHMTLGTYPESVPEDWLLKLPPEPIPSARAALPGPPTAFPSFRNIAVEAGVNTFGLSGGAVADDFNGDGWIDIVVTSWDPRVSMSCFLNRGDGTFEKSAANLEGIKGGLNLMQCDYDNDGDLDLFVSRGAWLKQEGRHPNSLLQNDGNARFTDVTYAVGLAEPAFPTQTAGWADYDLDGDLDLFVGNESSAGFEAPCQLFRNDGGRFVDVAQSAGLDIRSYVKGISWGDLDGDRFPDLILSCLGEPNLLMHNRRDGTFADETRRLSPSPGPRRSFPAWTFDYNNDGWLDIFISSYSTPPADYVHYYQEGQLKQENRAALFQNREGRGFIDQTVAAALDRPMLPMGSNFGDLTNNGYPDIYLGSGTPDFDAIVPNALFINDGGQYYDLTRTSRMGHLQKGHSVAMADFDQDGDLDIFQQMGGALPGDQYYDVLYQNPGFGRHWLGVKLSGADTNRFGVGCRVAVRIDEPGSGERWIYQWMNNGGSFGANPLQLHFGLGEAAAVEEVRVYWPVTGSTTIIESPEIDRILTVEEDR